MTRELTSHLDTSSLRPGQWLPSARGKRANSFFVPQISAGSLGDELCTLGSLASLLPRAVEIKRRASKHKRGEEKVTFDLLSPSETLLG